MKLRSKVLALSAIAVPAALVVSALPANAAGHSVSCPGNNVICVNSFYHGTKGTVSIDADVSGKGSGKYTWQLQTSSGTAICSASMTAVDPARSWICNNVPVGQLQVRMYTDTRGGSLGVRF